MINEIFKSGTKYIKVKMISYAVAQRTQNIKGSESRKFALLNGILNALSLTLKLLTGMTKSKLFHIKLLSILWLIISYKKIDTL